MNDKRSDSSSRLVSVLLACFAIAVTVAALIAGTAGSNSWWIDGLTWALIAASFGTLAFLLGLIFGLPRTRSGYTPTDSERYESNSNLERISDWLTTLLVGATLVQIGKAPGALADAADFVGGGLGVPNSRGYASSAILFGIGSGFVAGYLWARLRLRILLEISDRRASEESSQQKLERQIAGLEPNASPAEVADVADSVLKSTRASSERLPILWVDDRPANNAAIVRSLRDLNIDVRQVTTTREALDLLKEDDFSLVITDLGRREGSVNNPNAGFELLDQMQRLPIATPVIVFAGPRGVQNQDALIGAGARLVTQRATEVLKEAVRYATGSRRASAVSSATDEGDA